MREHEDQFVARQLSPLLDCYRVAAVRKNVAEAEKLRREAVELGRKLGDQFVYEVNQITRAAV